jgi:hypothetical protein
MDIAKYRKDGDTTCWFLSNWTMEQVEKRIKSLEDERDLAIKAMSNLAFKYGKLEAKLAELQDKDDYNERRT